MNIENGVYLIRRNVEQTKIPSLHYAVMDVGNNFEHNQADGSQPIVIEKHDQGISVNYLSNTTGPWTIVRKSLDINSTKKWLAEAIQKPNYDLLLDNCEHFARHVVQGKSKSLQVIAAISAAGCAALTAGILGYKWYRSLLNQTDRNTAT